MLYPIFSFTDVKEILKPRIAPTNRLRKAQTKHGYLRFRHIQHFSHPSKQCAIDTFHRVFHLSSPNFNEEMRVMWKRLGVPWKVVASEFPASGHRKKLHSCHDNAASNTEQHYSYETLRLALPASRRRLQWKKQGLFPLANIGESNAEKFVRKTEIRCKCFRGAIPRSENTEPEIREE